MAELETEESYRLNYDDALPEVKTKENLPKDALPEVKTDENILDSIKLEVIQHNNIEKLYEMFNVMKECFSDMDRMPFDVFIYWINNYDVKCYVMILDNQIIAVATVREKITKKSHYLQNFCVIESLRKMGIGKMFLNKISDMEEYVYWTDDKDKILFHTKIGAKIYKEDDNTAWFYYHNKTGLVKDIIELIFIKK